MAEARVALAWRVLPFARHNVELWLGVVLPEGGGPALAWVVRWSEAGAARWAQAAAERGLAEPPRLVAIARPPHRASTRAARRAMASLQPTERLAKRERAVA